MKFPRGTRVIFRHEGRHLAGRVTAVVPRRRKVVSDTGERTEVSVRALRRAPDRVLILESRLDRTLRSGRRTYGPMMKQWLEAYENVDVLYEKVHTIEDMKRFLRHEGRQAGTRFIHYIGHGENLGGKRACLRFTFERLDLFEESKLFAGLDGKVLLFSCCEVGGNLKALEHIKEASNASAIIAYRTAVRDHYTNLVEVLLYERIFAGVKPAAAAEQVSESLHLMGVRNERERKPVLVCI